GCSRNGASHGRLRILGTVETDLEQVSTRVAVRPITAKVAALAAQFPASYPGDPCDPLIGATVLAEGNSLGHHGNKYSGLQVASDNLVICLASAGLPRRRPDAPPAPLPAAPSLLALAGFPGVDARW